MKIDFEGYKYLLITLNNEYKACFTNLIEAVPGGHIATDFEGDRRLYDNKYFTLHTNPDYKEKEMKSDRLADEIMAKGKRSVYTQEMFDAGEAPKIGMEFIYGDDICYCVGFKRDGAMAFETEHGSMNAFCNKSGNSQAMPIDQRSDEEKAIDAVERWVESFAAVPIDSTELVSAIKNKQFPFLSFTGDKK